MTGPATLDALIVDDDTTSVGSKGIDVSGATAVLTLDDGTQIQGGSTGGTSAGTLTIESTAELLVTSGSTSLGAGLDGMFVTDNNASKGIDVSGAALRSATAP